ncbi:MAG: VWA domain-containing protein [Candidatus Rifleibacteriota bacterium]
MFTEPHWLILLLPALLVLFHLQMPDKKLFWLRLMILLLLIAALAGPHIKWASREGVVLMVADRSLSMPEDNDRSIKETFASLRNKMPETGRIGLVSFASDVRVDSAPSRSSFTGFNSMIDPQGSNLSEGLEKALALIPEGTSGKILLISDGQWTGKDPEAAAFKAAKRNIPIDFRFLARENHKDLAVTSFDLPGLLNPGEEFFITAEIYSPVNQSAELQLYADDNLIIRSNRKLKSGSNSIVFKHVAPGSSVVRYSMEVKPELNDPVIKNNKANAITEVHGQKPLLLISQGKSPYFASFLENMGVDFELKTPTNLHLNLETLAGYSGVIINNVSANNLSLHGMHVLSAWVENMGGGLMLTGGKNSYGTGGYYQSPLEEVLPVSLELRSEQRKLALALVVVLDRSGSMAAPTRGGRTKMDLANIAAAEALNLLSPMDEFGLLAVDTKAHEVLSLENVKNKTQMQNKILSVESMGGGIYVYEGLSKAAMMLSRAKAKTRHIILFADAADAEQPGRYWELLKKTSNAGLTVSVIGLGTERDQDANLLRKIAKRGNGRIFFTREPRELPRLFSQDTFVAARSTFIEEITPIESTGQLNELVADMPAFASALGGYNVVYSKPDASQLLITSDENHTPILSRWHVGLGKVCCYAGTTSREFSRPFAQTQQAGDIFAATIAWLAQDKRQFIDNMPVTQQLDNGLWKATLHLDPEREREFFKQNPEITLLRSSENEEVKEYKLTMQWDTADSLSASMQLSGKDAVVGIVHLGSKKKLQLYPVCMPYSQEYALPRVDEGLEKLEKIARITRGAEQIDLGKFWSQMPETRQYKSIADPMLLLALILFLFEVGHRRTAFLNLIFSKAYRKQYSADASGDNKKSESSVRKTSAKIYQNDSGSGIKDQKQHPPEKENKKTFSSALQRAKNKAGKRTK